jgi:menaquinone-9 beta-reductase
VHAALVVGADGRHSLVARRVNPMLEYETPPLRALFYRYVSHFRGPGGDAPDAAEFSLLGDEIAYVFPSDAGLTCVAMSVNLATFQWLRRDLQPRHAGLLARHHGLATRVAAATAEGRVVGCGPEPSYVRVPYGPGWALVGDAGLHQDPWSGLGMDMASVHATFLADAIIDWLHGSADEQTAMATYHERRNAHALEAYHDTIRGAADLRTLDA